MSAGISIDVSEFHTALKEYLRFTSKEIPVAINGKLRDMMFMAAKYAPFNNAEFSAEEYARNRRPEYITFKTIQRYGENPPGVSRGGRILKTGKRGKRKGSTLSPGQVWGMTERNKVARRLRKRHTGLRGYMSSAFVKAGLEFAPAASKVRPPKKRFFHGLTGAESVKRATEKSMTASVVAHWSAKSAKDATDKERLALMGLRAGLITVTDDMRAYILRKMEQQAKKNSASTARAITGAFR